MPLIGHSAFVYLLYAFCLLVTNIVFISFILFQMAFPSEDDDDLDVEALRLAALSTLKKTAAQPTNTPSSSMSTLQVNNGPRLQLKGGPRPHQNRGRGRGHNMNMNMRRGRGRGGFPNSFNPSQVKYISILSLFPIGCYHKECFFNIYAFFIPELFCKQTLRQQQSYYHSSYCTQ